jgi:hypothetical protein
MPLNTSQATSSERIDVARLDRLQAQQIHQRLQLVWSEFGE